MKHLDGGDDSMSLPRMLPTVLADSLGPVPHVVTCLVPMHTSGLGDGGLWTRSHKEHERRWRKMIERDP
jgi:hypothetical protein